MRKSRSTQRACQNRWLVSWGGEGPGDRVGRNLLAKVVLDAQYVRANAFATMGKSVTVAQQTAILQNDVVIPIGAVDSDAQGLLVGPHEAFRLGLVTVCFRDQTVKVRLQHGARLAS
jgi:hypothetical protein